MWASICCLVSGRGRDPDALLFGIMLLQLQCRESEFFLRSGAIDSSKIKPHVVMKW